MKLSIMNNLIDLSNFNFHMKIDLNKKKYCLKLDYGFIRFNFWIYPNDKNYHISGELLILRIKKMRTGILPRIEPKTWINGIISASLLFLSFSFYIFFFKTLPPLWKTNAGRVKFYINKTNILESHNLMFDHFSQKFLETIIAHISLVFLCLPDINFIITEMISD